MDPGDDAYEILGVPESASSTEIRTAYRKLALRHHPDKHTTTEAKERATKMFAKISNAYEILSDLEQKQEYDALRQRQQQQQPQEEHFHYGQSSSAGRASSTTSHRIDDLFQNFFFRHHFHDPFQVFEQFFQNDSFGRSGASYAATAGGRGVGGRSPFGGTLHSSFFGSDLDPFADPFFGGFGMNGAAGINAHNTVSSLFQHHPYGGFGGGILQHQTAGRGGIFESMQQMISSSMAAHSSMLQSSSTFYSSSSSTTTTSTRHGQNGETIVSQTRVIQHPNGQQETIVERTIHQPDGTVQRVVNTSTSNGHNNSAQRARITNTANDNVGSRRRSHPSQLQPQSVIRGYLPDTTSVVEESVGERSPLTGRTTVVATDNQRCENDTSNATDNHYGAKRTLKGANSSGIHKAPSSKHVKHPPPRVRKAECQQHGKKSTHTKSHHQK